MSKTPPEKENVFGLGVLFALLSVRTRSSESRLEGDVGRDGFASNFIDLMHRDRAERRGIGQRAMAGVEFPERADYADGPAGGLELHLVAAFVEPDLGGGRDHVVPAKVVGRDERPRIGESPPRQIGDGFLPGGSGSAAAVSWRTPAANKIAIVRPRPTVRSSAVGSPSCNRRTLRWAQRGL